MERIPRDRMQGDSECARMCFGVYKTQPENAELARMFDNFECDLCGQDVKNCRLVCHCPDCDEVYCQQCAREIPQNPKEWRESRSRRSFKRTSCIGSTIPEKATWRNWMRN